MSQHHLLGRTGELGAIADFLTSSACVRPSGLAIEGEAGIGKTTLWSAAAEQARERGYCVLTARAGQAESAMGCAAVADLLSDVPSSVLGRLPKVQRAAVDSVLLRGDVDGPQTDQRAVAAAVLSIVETLAADAPVLVAVDDLQWLDACSRAALTFAIRRLKPPVGVLVTERPAPGRPTAMTWLRVGAKNDDFSRMSLGPLSLRSLHALISDRLGRSLPRPTMVRIAEVARGNPFYALELARAIGQSAPEQALPRTLADLVRSRIADVDDEVCDMLLAAACATDPTVELLAQAKGITAAEAVALLETAEDRGIVGIQGNRVQFTHPILARGIYADARRSRRRKMHRTLAEVEALPEMKARHLALSATSSEDPTTLEALDAAAEAARARGAPAEAAELVDLAIGLGGDTFLRRIRSARYHYQAGNSGHARALLEPRIRELQPGPLRATALGLLAEIRMYHDSFAQAAELLDRALEDAEGDSALLVQTLLLSSFARLDTGEYDRSLRDVSAAVTLIDGRDPALSSQVLAMWVTANFICGHGVDQPRLQRALELEDRDADVPVPFRASAVNGLVLAWAGRLDEAHAQMSTVRTGCVERGGYRHLMFIDLHATLIEVWRGDFTEAAQIAQDAMERAEQFGGDHELVIADAIAAVVAAYAGPEQEARTHARAAIERASSCGSPRLADRAIMSLGFLEVSLGNYADALTTLEPLLAPSGTLPGTEIVTAAFLPDAIEAMIALGRLDDAGPMIDALEHHGRRLDRPWMLAVGARCRTMMLAARGQLEAATAMAQQAITEHQRLPMPFERARTQLLLGQLQRRQRQKEAATIILTEALTAFEEMKTPLWAERTRSELARTQVSADRTRLLTPSEQRVAELAAAGLTNRDIAAAVFISPKTVEANLASIYRKLGIHTRAELGGLIGQQTEGEQHSYPAAANG